MKKNKKKERIEKEEEERKKKMPKKKKCRGRKKEKKKKTQRESVQVECVWGKVVGSCVSEIIIKKVRKYYLNKRWCIIDNLMRVIL